MTTQNGVRVSLSFSDWLRLIGLVFVLAATIVGVFWRQNELIRDVATEQVLLKQRVERLEQR